MADGTYEKARNTLLEGIGKKNPKEIEGALVEYQKIPKTKKKERNDAPLVELARDIIDDSSKENCMLQCSLIFTKHFLNMQS